MEHLNKKTTKLMYGFDEALDRTRDEVMPTLARVVDGVKNIEPEMVMDYIKMLQDRILSESKSLDGMDKDSYAYQNLATYIILTTSCLMAIEDKTLDFLKLNVADMVEAENAESVI